VWCLEFIIVLVEVDGNMASERILIVLKIIIPKACKIPRHNQALPSNQFLSSL